MGMGDAVVKVVNRCNDAKESKVLDLSMCSLMHVPEAVYFVLREAEIIKCNLSNNLISKITPQFGGSCFTNLTTLNVSTNSVLLELESVSEINAKSNFITEVNEEELENTESLEVVNLENNKLSASCHDRLKRVDKIRIIISERKLEEWEDLSI